MFVSGPWPVRVGRAGQEADGGEVGGGGGGVGLRDEAARAVLSMRLALGAREGVRRAGLVLTAVCGASFDFVYDFVATPGVARCARRVPTTVKAVLQYRAESETDRVPRACVF